MDTEVVAIVDMSGSMAGHNGTLTAETIGAFNAWLEQTAQGQKQGEDVRISVTTFSFTSRPQVTRVPIRSCPLLGTPENPYHPAGGTALLDAVGDTLTAVKEYVGPGKKALVMIVTDGDENSSRRWNQPRLAGLMAELEATERYAFLYMGASWDSWAQAQAQYGDVSGFATRAASFDRADIGMAFASAGVASMSYLAADAAGAASMRNTLGEQTISGMGKKPVEDDTEAPVAR